jgi:hypothetical protein
VPFSVSFAQRAMSLPPTITQMAGAMGLLGLTLAIIGLYAPVAHRWRGAMGKRHPDGDRRWQRAVLTMVLTGTDARARGHRRRQRASWPPRPLQHGRARAAQPLHYLTPSLILVGLTLLVSYVPARRPRWSIHCGASRE